MEDSLTPFHKEGCSALNGMIGRIVFHCNMAMVRMAVMMMVMMMVIGGVVFYYMVMVKL